MEVVPIPVLSDNYAYLLIDRTQHVAAAIDPVDPSKVLATAHAHNVTITMILTTHRHHDHAGGNQELRELIYQETGRNIPVYGGADDHCLAMTHPLHHHDELTLGAAVQIQVLHTPCHTRGHVLYLCNQEALFTGDTLFIGGCGRFFEGTAAEMHSALNHAIVQTCPPETKVYCGHEYTRANLEFAAHVEPANKVIHAKLQWASEINMTIPSTIAEEQATNPFMRVQEPSVQKFTGYEDPVDVMHALREAKNRFKP